MPKYLGEIAVKRSELAKTIEDLQRNSRIVVRLRRSEAVAELGDEIAFQSARQQLLDWAVTQDEAALRAQHQAHVDTLPEEAIDCRYGASKGLPMNVLSKIAFLELLEIALGEHPGQARRPLVDDVEPSHVVEALIDAVTPAQFDVDAQRGDAIDQIEAPITIGKQP